jgi:hypothetical protein
MTQRTRYFLLISALVVAVCLCTGLVAYYSGNLPFGNSSKGPAELAYLPEDTAVVAYADVRAVMNSEVAKKLREALPTGEEKERIQAELGVDLEKDVDSVLVGTSGVGPGPMGNGVLVLIRGKFDPARIEAIAQSHGGHFEDYNGKRLVLMTMDAPNVNGQGANQHARGGMSFVEPNLIAIGDIDAIKHGIDSAKSGAKNITDQAELMGYIGTVATQNTAWVVGKFDELAKRSPVPADIAAQLPPVQWVMAGVHIDGGISGQVRAEARDVDAAKNLRDVIQGGLAAAHLLAGKDTRVDTMVNSLQVGGTGKTVSVGFTVPPEVLSILNGVAGLHNLTKPTPAPAPTKPGK